jgi:hypothetical protein
MYNYKAKLLCKDGSTLSVLIASSGLFDEEKNFIHTRCFTIKDPAGVSALNRRSGTPGEYHPGSSSFLARHRRSVLRKT